jgi:glycosyltransferase involved in cell wall biosynthesis
MQLCPPSLRIREIGLAQEPLNYTIVVEFRSIQMRISVVMPIYNERATLRQVVEEVLSVPLTIELLCVDDGSTDGSREILQELQQESMSIRVLLQPRNRGKGAAFYKAFRREVIQSIQLEEDRFGFEPEVTVKVAKRNLRVYEVGISYWGRTYEEGKKIGWKDGLRALWFLVKYSIKEPRLRYANPVEEPTPVLVETANRDSNGSWISRKGEAKELERRRTSADERSDR